MLRMVAHPRRPQSGHFTCYLHRTYHVLPTRVCVSIAMFTSLCYRVLDSHAHAAKRGCVTGPHHRHVALLSFTEAV